MSKRKTRRSGCPDCYTPMKPIQIVDATECTFYLCQSGDRHVPLTFAAAEAKASFLFKQFSRLGSVKGMICPDCHRIELCAQEPIS